MRPSAIRLLIGLTLIFGLFPVARGEIPAGPSFNPQEAAAFLDRMVGRWVGHYEVRGVDGQLVQRLEAEMLYLWHEQNGERTLKGRVVYAGKGAVVVAESETFIGQEEVLSLVEQGGKTRAYRGRISEDGDSIRWTPIDTGRELDESIRQSLGRDDDGDDVMDYRGFENVIRQGIEVMLTLSGRVTRAPLEGPRIDESRNY